MTRVDVLGVGVDPVDLDGAVAAAAGLAGDPGPHLVVTANVELIMRARGDPDLREILHREIGRAHV